MAILIKDLPDSIELDRQAMTAIAGGSRIRGRQTTLGRTVVRPDRIVNYPAGFAGKQLAETDVGGSKHPGGADD